MGVTGRPRARGTRLPASDLRGASRLVIDAVTGLTDVVEAMHEAIATVGRPRGRTRGITGFAYASVRGMSRLVGRGLDGSLSLLPVTDGDDAWPRREALVAALNGVVGDHLAASGNPLAIPMAFRRDGRPLPGDAAALRAALPANRRRVVVLVHGLCMNDLQWHHRGHDHGAALARDLGYTPVYLHYNTGLHVSTNGRLLARRLEALVKAWSGPLDELVLLGHSGGGLVLRSACHQAAEAGHAWLRAVRKAVFLGTPHHGSPLERAGHQVDVALGLTPFTAPLARLGHIRSPGITDLRHGNLLDADWQGRDRFARGGARDDRRPLPLPTGVRCYAVAATRGRLTPLGDGLVPLTSALGRHRDPERCLPFPASHQWVGRGLGHLDLLSHPEVYAQLRAWLSA